MADSTALVTALNRPFGVIHHDRLMDFAEWAGTLYMYRNIPYIDIQSFHDTKQYTL